MKNLVKLSLFLCLIGCGGNKEEKAESIGDTESSLMIEKTEWEPITDSLSIPDARKSNLKIENENKSKDIKCEGDGCDDIDIIIDGNEVDIVNNGMQNVKVTITFGDLAGGCSWLASKTLRPGDRKIIVKPSHLPYYCKIRAVRTSSKSNEIVSIVDTTIVASSSESAANKTTFYSAKCKSHGFISNWHYDRRNAETAKKHHENKWSTGGVLDPNHRVTIETITN